MNTKTDEMQQTEQNTFDCVKKETQQANQKLHTHKWVFYDGALGYESYVCSICRVDFKDLCDNLTLEQCSLLHVTIEGKEY